MKRLATFALMAVLAVPQPLLAASGGTTEAAPAAAPSAGTLPAQAAPAPSEKAAPSPALDLSRPTPEPRPVTRQWWFWTAVGAVVAATVTIVVLSNRDPTAPATTLGNREFTP